MAIIIKQKCSPKDLFVDKDLLCKAIVLFEDGICRLVHGHIIQTQNENLFTFTYEGYTTCVSESSYKKLYDNITESEAYDIVCRFNIDSLLLGARKPLSL